jgi:hypothetical protein
MLVDSLTSKDMLGLALAALVGSLLLASIGDARARILFVALAAAVAYVYYERLLDRAASAPRPRAQMELLTDGFDRRDVVWAKTFEVERTTDGASLRYLYLHPEVVAVLHPLRAFTQFKKGTLESLVTYLEHFYELYYACLLGRSMNVRQDAETLVDLRDAALNAVHNLHFAFPTRPWARFVRRATRVVQASTYRCLKSLHNKYGSSEFKNDFFYWSPKPLDRSKTASYDVY